MQPDATKRVPVGIPGLDEVLRGGVPPRTLLLVEGPPGSGKTTLALQFLLHGARQGETSLLVTSAETSEQLRAIAASHGWNLDGIHIVEWRDQADSNGDPAAEYTLFPEAEVEVGETLAQLFSSVERLRPGRLVIDTISSLRVLAPSSAFYRRQLIRIRDVLSSYGCTTLLLEDAMADEKDIRSQTLADALIELQQTDFKYGGDRRRLRVRKLRRAGYVGGFHDFNIVTGGLVVFPRLVAATHERVPRAAPAARSGLAELDALAGGGLPRGSSTLFVGPAGSGKSTLSSLYLFAAAARGERSAVYLFDESPGSYIARSRGLGMDIGPLVEEGRIIMNPLNPAELTPGEIAHRLIGQVEQENVRFVAIDTLNGYLHSAAEEPMILLHLRELLVFLANRDVVTLLVLTQHGILNAEMASSLDISFLADNVFLLRYFEADGAVRQVVSMVKKRTGAHERTLRELHLTAEGVKVGEQLRGSRVTDETRRTGLRVPDR